MAFFGYVPAPMIFDNRGLPAKDMDWRLEPVYRVNGVTSAARIGNVMHVDLPRPRTRKALLEHPKYYEHREELLTFLADCNQTHAQIGENA